MKVYIAFLRGINVGGKNTLPMKELVTILNSFGLENVKTYIQSGNVVFTIKDAGIKQLSSQISLKVKEKFGFAPDIHLLTLNELEDAISNNPFPEAESKPESLHLGFLASKPTNPNLMKLEALRIDSERYLLKDKIFYFTAPEGVGRSKLAANSEKALGVSLTDRNWRTVCKIRDLAKEIILK